jgi:outer membrane biosynthesis protein TonB
MGSLLLVACATTETAQQKPVSGAAQEEGSTGAGTVTAEQNDAIEAIFKRKAPQLQSCWQEEYDKTHDRKKEGDLLVALTVATSGKPEEVKVLKSSLESPGIESCVVKEVASWAFPAGSAPTPYRRTVHLGAQF